MDWAWHLNAEAIFDDQPPAIKEAREWGLEALAISGTRPHQGSSFETFSKAVDYT